MKERGTLISHMLREDYEAMEEGRWYKATCVLHTQTGLIKKAVGKADQEKGMITVLYIDGSQDSHHFALFSKPIYFKSQP